MKLAVDTWMLWCRGDSIRDAFQAVAKAGFPYTELAPREDFLPLYSGRRATRQTVDEVRAASKRAGVEIASLFVEYASASADEAVRSAAVRYWKQAIEIAVDVGCDRINGELTGDYRYPKEGEAALLRTLDEILPVCEANGITIALEAHPGDFTESGIEAIDLIRGIGSDQLCYLQCVPHTFYLGHHRLTKLGLAERPFATNSDIIRYGADVLGHVHIADTLRPEKIFLNAANDGVRAHSHTDIGTGDIDWVEVFSALKDIDFDGVMTVVAWRQDGREDASMHHNRQKVAELMAEVGWSPA